MTFQELVKNNTTDVVESLLSSVLSKEFVEIRFDFLNNDQCAVITTHQYEEDKEISLRLHINKQFDLHCGYYDDEDEFFEFTQPLSIEMQQNIPEGLQKIMQKVVEDEQGLRVQSALLTKTRRA